jgi:hypothetical protein
MPEKAYRKTLKKVKLICSASLSSGSEQFHKSHILDQNIVTFQILKMADRQRSVLKRRHSPIEFIRSQSTFPLAISCGCPLFRQIRSTASEFRQNIFPGTARSGATFLLRARRASA